MPLKDINFGDIDAKNEILKQTRAKEKLFFESFFIRPSLPIDDFLSGQKSFILGLKGTGKTALLRYLKDLSEQVDDLTHLILFKSQVTEEDRQALSDNSGYEIVGYGDTQTFIQDFKESWKWIIYQRIAKVLKESEFDTPDIAKFLELTGIHEGRAPTLGSLLTKIKGGKLKLGIKGYGVAVELGIDSDRIDSEERTVSISELNRVCSSLLNDIDLSKKLYVFFDELELFHQTQEQFDRDRRIVRDLIYAISQINADSAENGRNIYLVATLRSEVLHSVLQLGHEISRDVDDYGLKLDWSDGKETKDHQLLKMIAKKIALSSQTPEDKVWETFFPDNINNQPYYQFILNSSYYRPRDIVRLLRVAREFDQNAETFTTEHFDQTATKFSEQTWIEITEELLASYSHQDIEALQKLFLGFSTHFFKEDLEHRIETRHKRDHHIQELLKRKNLTQIFSDLYRIGIIGNDFVSHPNSSKRRIMRRWIYRGNSTLNEYERMAFHKSLWKHLSLSNPS